MAQCASEWRAQRLSSFFDFDCSSYKQAFRIYLFAFILFYFPWLLGGKLIIPFRPSLETGIHETRKDGIENRKFSDYFCFYIPEIKEHINGRRSGWISTWTDQNELGRPLSHLSGFSPAYLPTWIMQKIIVDPYRFITLYSIGTCFLTGVFCLLLVMESGISPLAGLLCAWLLATSPAMLYWLTFPMFISVWCWGAGIMYCVVRLEKGWHFRTWALLSFCSYSILMTGYPQLVLLHIYLIGAYFAFCVALLWRRSGRDPALR